MLISGESQEYFLKKLDLPDYLIISVLSHKNPLANVNKEPRLHMMYQFDGNRIWILFDVSKCCFTASLLLMNNYQHVTIYAPFINSQTRQKFNDHNSDVAIFSR